MRSLAPILALAGLASVLALGFWLGTPERGAASVRSHLAARALPPLPGEVIERSGVRWIPFTPEAVVRCRESGFPVLVVADNDWEPLGKINLWSVLGGECQPAASIRELLNSREVVPFLADVTLPHPAFDELLAEAREGTYYLWLVIPPEGPAIRLPPCLSPRNVADAFTAAGVPIQNGWIP